MKEKTSNHYLGEELAEILSHENLFEDATKLKGEVYRELEGRRTLRFLVGQEAYFLKIHFGVGWKEIFKNLSQLRLPVLGAKNEWLAVNRLRELGIDTMTPVAYANQGGNPATLHSCLITKALDHTLSLEQLGTNSKIGLGLRWKLIDKLAGVAKKMHGDGINHRDFYLCHFLIDMDCVTVVDDVMVQNTQNRLRVYLIDLHRAQIRDQTPVRWRIKDLGGLLFSAADAGLTRKDLLRFVKLYTGSPLRETFEKNSQFWSAVVQRAHKLYLKDHGRISPLLSHLV